MSIVLELTPQEEARLQQEAQKIGLDLPAYARRRLGLTGNVVSFTAQLERKAAIALLEEWRLEDATDDEEELEQRDKARAELQANLNATRQQNGEEPLF